MYEEVDERKIAAGLFELIASNSAPDWFTEQELAVYLRLVNKDGKPVTSGIRKWAARDPIPWSTEVVKYNFDAFYNILHRLICEQHLCNSFHKSPNSFANCHRLPAALMVMFGDTGCIYESTS